MKRFILTLLVVSLFPFFVLGACDPRSLINDVNRDNCVWGGGTWNSSDCTCSSGDSGGVSGGEDGGEASPCEPGKICNPIKYGTFDALLKAFTNWIVNIGLALAPLVIVYGGFLHITAAGNPEQASKGKKLILYAVIGLIVVLLAGSLIDIIKDIANTTE